MKKQFLIYAGILVMLASGCGTNAGAAAAGQFSQEAATAGQISSEVADPVNLTDKEPGSQNATYIAASNGIDGIQTVDSATMEQMEKEYQVRQESLKKSILEQSGNDESWFVQSAADAVKEYFNIEIDTDNYDVSVVYWDSDFRYDEIRCVGVQLNHRENAKNVSDIEVGAEFQVDILETGETGWVDAYWMEEGKELEVPVSVEQAKKLTKEFLVENQMLASDRIECMGGAYASADRIDIGYQYGESDGIMAGVNSLDGRIYYISYMPKESVMVRITPVEEGKILG